MPQSIPFRNISTLGHPFQGGEFDWLQPTLSGNRSNGEVGTQSRSLCSAKIENSLLINLMPLINTMELGLPQILC
jgi:hypothetical protein